MSFLQVYLSGFLPVLVLMTVLWMVSARLKNTGIVDIYWGIGFIILAMYYRINTQGSPLRKNLLLIMVCLWGLRLAIHIAHRNWGKGEDFRYREFRQKYGPHRYWWISFFQVFLLQGLLMWLISAPLLGAQFYSSRAGLNIIDILGLLLWLTGFIFEAGGDVQLNRFKKNPQNRGKVMDKGLWKYTRHPNYFGDSCIWWAYGLLSLAGGSYIPLYGPVIMTLLLLKVSGVALLEKTLQETKPQYRDYVAKTSAFFPLPPGR
jgi:steroid 5-alpha reductase family enzyme